MDRPGTGTLDYGAFRALVMPHLQAALYPAGGNTWSAPGARSLDQLAVSLHDWIEQAVCELAPEANRACPINRLPKEVLCMIFTLVAHPDGVFNLDALLDLADVCSYWAAVVRGTPGFWTTIRLAKAEYETDSVAGHLAWRLGRALGAPVDLSLELPDNARADALAAAALPHLHHVRVLELDAPEPVLAGAHPAAAALLSAPAPALIELGLHSPSPGRATASESPPPAPFPPDLFSGAAPVLRHLFLNRVGPPPPAWAPLATLTRIEYVARAPDVLALVAAVLAAPALRLLSVHLDGGLQLPAQWPAQLPPPRADGTLRSVNISATSAPLPGVLGFLARIAARDPHRLFVHVVDAPACADWLLRAVATLRAPALHLGDCVLSGQGNIAATATAIGPAGERRATFLSLAGLAVLSETFGALRELTIGEALWPAGPVFPALPRLETLTVVLEHPALSWEGMTAVLLLPLAPGHAWALPALRALRLAHVERFVRGPARIGRLVVSAADVAQFLMWNLHTDSPVELVLQNVLLLEEPGSPWRRRLDQLVQHPGVVLESTYSPIACEITDLFTAIHPW